MCMCACILRNFEFETYQKKRYNTTKYYAESLQVPQWPLTCRDLLCQTGAPALSHAEAQAIPEEGSQVQLLRVQPAVAP